MCPRGYECTWAPSAERRENKLYNFSTWDVVISVAAPWHHKEPYPLATPMSPVWIFLIVCILRIGEINQSGLCSITQTTNSCTSEQCTHPLASTSKRLNSVLNSRDLHCGCSHELSLHGQKYKQQTFFTTDKLISYTYMRISRTLITTDRKTICESPEHKQQGLLQSAHGVVYSSDRR